MVNVHIVTDSCAHFANPALLRQHPVTVVPNKISLGSKTYREGIDISAEDALTLIAQSPKLVKLSVPTIEEYTAVYNRLSHEADAILSIHASRELYPSWQNARAAAQPMIGSTQVAVIDSRTLCVAQGMLVNFATRIAQQDISFDEMVRQVRGAADRLYTIYTVEALDFLLENRIMSPSHTILGSMLGIKPFVTIEEGRLVPVEKVKTRTQTIERLVEFAVEFTEVEDTLIVQNKAQITDLTRALQERLAVEFPDKEFPYATYSAAMAMLIGADAAGIVILECEMEDLDDDL
ncbi:MAG: DegV family protein [bacterium]|nr:DegV family protein [bacterium]